MITDFYNVSIPPVGEPITFDEASDWCRDIDVADTALVESLIAAAVEYCENYVNRIFVERTIVGNFTVYSASKFEPYAYIELRRSPLISVDEIRINGDIIDPADYIVGESLSFSRVLFPSILSLDYTDTKYPIQATFQAGYGAKDSQPGWVETAIKQLVLFWYENRGDVAPDKKQLMPFVLKAILNQRRILNTYG